MNEQERAYPPVPIGVSGGAGGQVARTEDMRLAARALEEAAVEVTYAKDYVEQAERVASHALPDAVDGVRERVAEAYWATQDAHTAAGGFREVSRELDDTAARLAEVAREFEEAEAAAYQGLSMWTRVSRGLFDWAQISLWTHRTVLGTVAKLSPLDWISRARGGEGLSAALMPDEGPRVTGLVNGATVAAVAGLLDRNYGWAGNAYENVLLLLSRSTAFLEWWAREPNYTGVNRVGDQEGIPQPRGVADLLQNVSDTAQLDHGGVTIDTIKHPDGTVSHIVNIPGTDDHSLSGASVRDWNSNLNVTDNNASDAAQMVRDAIEAAGIGPDEAIMLQGHSQGGGVAAYLAASALQGEYTISHVVAYGAAPDRMPILEDVQYLNLVTTQDVTPGADGRRPPDLPNVTTVEADLLSAEDPAVAAQGATLAGAHSFDAHLAAANSFDESSHASIKAWKESASGFLGEGEMSSQHFAPTFEERAPLMGGNSTAHVDPQGCQQQPLFGPGRGPHGPGIPSQGYKPALPDWLNPKSPAIPDVRELVGSSAGGA